MKKMSFARTPFQITVQNIVNTVAAEYTGGVVEFMATLSDKGMDSGMVTPLNDYSETLPIYEEYKEEMNDILQKAMVPVQTSIRSIGGTYDREDPLFLQDGNQHGVTRFCFYVTARRLFELEFI